MDFSFQDLSGTFSMADIAIGSPSSVARSFPVPSGTIPSRGLAAPPLLVLAAKPVPAFRLVGRGRLSRIDDEATPFLSQLVHARPGREVVR